MTIRGIVAPLRYDPRVVTPGIVHVGVGNCHRAHQARYLHDLLTLADPVNGGSVARGCCPLTGAARPGHVQHPRRTHSGQLDRDGTYRNIRADGAHAALGRSEGDSA